MSSVVLSSHPWHCSHAVWMSSSCPLALASWGWQSIYTCRGSWMQSRSNGARGCCMPAYRTRPDGTIQKGTPRPSGPPSRACRRRRRGAGETIPGSGMPRSKLPSNRDNDRSGVRPTRQIRDLEHVLDQSRHGAQPGPSGIRKSAGPGAAGVGPPG